MSISSNTLFTLLSVTFSHTYSFDVLVEATVDVASPCILLNLQSSTLAAIRLFGSQPLLLSNQTLIRYTLRFFRSFLHNVCPLIPLPRLVVTSKYVRITPAFDWSIEK
ncbi:hypothetical protein BHM03_00031478 [Ensete ventricosum]|uniref:Uncharacterized protein n=1 Tax=Ensete ventricosum TaxID=4639 RepID=A0A445MID5_ENSVE|nr:hypothetical protein BHM03_00031478 [Ensete ventricosum]